MAFETTKELRQYVESELGHELDVNASSSDKTAIINHLDRAHKIVCGGGGLLNYDERNVRIRDEVTFAWARSKFPKIVTLQTSIENLDCSVTNNSASATLSATYATSLTDWFIRFSEKEEVYRISAHSADSASITLDGVYVEDSGTKDCTIFKLVYDIGSDDVLGLISPVVTHDGESNISITDFQELNKRYPIQSVCKQFPSMAGILKEADGTVTVQFNSYPDELERIEVNYIPIPATLVEDSQDPIIPKQHRLVIAELAAYHMLIRNDDDRAIAHLQNARLMFRDLVAHNEQLYGGADENLGRVFHNYNPISDGSYPSKSVVKAYD